MTNVIKTISNTIKYWYLPLILGILFVIFGIYIFTVPVETYTVISTIFSISFIVSGLFEIFFSIQNRNVMGSWGWYLVGGILGLAIGIFLVIKPEIASTTLSLVVGFVLLFRALQLLIISFDLKKLGVINWGILAIVAIIGIIVSIILLLNPVFTSISIVVFTALSIIIFGIGLIIFSLDLRKIKNLPKKIKKELENALSDND